MRTIDLRWNSAPYLNLTCVMFIMNYMIFQYHVFLWKMNPSPTYSLDKIRVMFWMILIVFMLPMSAGSVYCPLIGQAGNYLLGMGMISVWQLPATLRLETKIILVTVYPTFWYISTYIPAISQASPLILLQPQLKNYSTQPQLGSSWSRCTLLQQVSTSKGLSCSDRL